MIEYCILMIEYLSFLVFIIVFYIYLIVLYIFFLILFKFAYRRHRRHKKDSEFPRSRSYSGSTPSTSHQPRKAPSAPGLEDAEWDNESVCSTCSSSSSEDFDYELPPRRAYGGVRISYVPNDAMAYARHQAALNQNQTPGSPSSRKRTAEKVKNCIIS